MATQYMSHSPSVAVSFSGTPLRGTVTLVSSKSESNRALIINAVSGNKCTLQNLSAARDTQTMQRLLASNEETLDVIDAGTTMRFLTAFTALRGTQNILTGTPRMCERPIGILVDALRSLGADITYMNKEGFPPLRITPSSVNGNSVTMRGDVSSQFISAILMVSPLLHNGLTMTLTGHVASRPYLEMTLKLMAHFGVSSSWVDDHTIHIAPGQQYSASTYTIESDWSGASYWFSLIGLAPEGSTLFLPSLKQNSLQGDSAIVRIMQPMGVDAAFEPEGVRLTKNNHSPAYQCIDFDTCPDLAQTVVAYAAAKGITLYMTGLESLRIKETDRIAALQNEIAKYGATMQETTYVAAMPEAWKDKTGLFVMEPAAKDMQTVFSKFTEAAPLSIATYDDHRMAMAFAPLSVVCPYIVLQDREVVNKSYPGFWNDLKNIGFQLT